MLTQAKKDFANKITDLIVEFEKEYKELSISDIGVYRLKALVSDGTTDDYYLRVDVEIKVKG